MQMGDKTYWSVQDLGASRVSEDAQYIVEDDVQQAKKAPRKVASCACFLSGQDLQSQHRLVSGSCFKHINESAWFVPVEIQQPGR